MMVSTVPEHDYADFRVTLTRYWKEAARCIRDPRLQAVQRSASPGFLATSGCGQLVPQTSRFGAAFTSAATWVV